MAPPSRPKNLWTVYKITCKITGYLYIGCTCTTLSERFTQHVYKARVGSKTKLHTSIRELGADQFEIIGLIDIVNKYEAYDKEAELIKELNPEYNQTSGGLGSRGFKHNQQTKSILSDMKRGFKHSEETKLRMSKSRSGSKRGPPSEETKRKISETLRRKHSIV